MTGLQKYGHQNTSLPFLHQDSLKHTINANMATWQIHERVKQKARTFRGINLLRIAKLKNYYRFISTRDEKEWIKKENQVLARLDHPYFAHVHCWHISKRNHHRQPRNPMTYDNTQTSWKWWSGVLQNDGASRIYIHSGWAIFALWTLLHNCFHLPPSKIVLFFPGYIDLVLV